MFKLIIIAILVTFVLNAQASVRGDIIMVDSLNQQNNANASALFNKLDECIASTVEARDEFVQSLAIPLNSLFVGMCTDLNNGQLVYSTMLRK